jgi:hypothetical protein
VQTYPKTRCSTCFLVILAIIANPSTMLSVNNPPTIFSKHITEITCRLPFAPAQPEPTFHLMEEGTGYLFLKNADSTPAHGVAANSFLRET